jgi:hypothetical protein
VTFPIGQVTSKPVFSGGNRHWLMKSGQYIVFFNDYLHLHRFPGHMNKVAFKHEDRTEIIGLALEFLLPVFQAVNRYIRQKDTGSVKFQHGRQMSG